MTRYCVTGKMTIDVYVEIDADTAAEAEIALENAGPEVYAGHGSDAGMVALDDLPDGVAETVSLCTEGVWIEWADATEVTE